MLNEDYIPVVLREFHRLKRLADGALDQCAPEHLFSVSTPGDNAIAVIMKHLSGNMHSRWTDFLTTDGEKPDRMRDQEFAMADDDTRERLFARWEEAWQTLFSSVRALTLSDLHRVVTIRNEPLTVLQAINRQLTHCAYHVGQIVYLAKHFSGSRWHSLSIPLGGSEQFNRSPRKYIEPA